MRRKLIEEYFTSSVAIQRAWKSQVMSLIADENLSIAQMGILFLIKEEQPATSSTIAKRMYITRSAVTQLVDGLDQLGYVTRTEDTDDRRITQIALSKKGTNKIKSLDKRRRMVFEKLITNLSDEQIASAIEINAVMLTEIEK